MFYDEDEGGRPLSTQHRARLKCQDPSAIELPGSRGSLNGNSECQDKPTPRNHDGYNTYTDPDGDNTVPPDLCTTPFDAIALIRDEIFVFIGKWFWRINSGKIVRGPINIHKFWYGLPRTAVVKIDAVFERPTDKRIILFSGDRYWIFNANSLVRGFNSVGRHITEFGIPADVKYIDAAFTWGFNRRSYLVSDDMYWKLDENITYVASDYPRDMSIWQGVPIPLDAAFQYQDGHTYFFKDCVYWKFFDRNTTVDYHYPRSIAQDWLPCSGSSTQNPQQRTSQSQGSIVNPEHQDEDPVESSAQTCTTALWLSWLSLLVTAFCIGQG